MRGTLFDVFGAIGGDGLIPTYAGNTCTDPAGNVLSRAHPHVCGEHSQCTFNHCRVWGSSPRMRGTLTVVELLATGNGLIPTYAGNTRGMTMELTPGRAHPHVCGEHALLENLALKALGSSPRMRGTRITPPGSGSPIGFIPTYAGNTLSRRWAFSRFWAHPHVCGEHGRP